MDNTKEFSKQLKLKQINLTRSGQKILDQVTLALPSPGVTVLLGANGAGKSSLLRVLAGISQPDSGATETGAIERAFLMPEPGVFYPHLTVAEQLQFVAHQCGGGDANFCKTALHAWQLAAESDKLTSHLSLGFRQRLSLAQLAVSRADLLLLDEPMNGMDPAVMQLFQEQITRWRQSHTVVMATHIMHEAEVMADWVVVMHLGRVLHSGAYDQGTPLNALYQHVVSAHLNPSMTGKTNHVGSVS